MREILERVAQGKLSVGRAEKLLQTASVAEVENFAKIDVNREQRKGIPEVVLAEGKNPIQVAKIAERLLRTRGRVILSRLSAEHEKALKHLRKAGIQESRKGSLLVLKKKALKTTTTGGKIGILSAGTSDIPIAEEAELIAKEMGCKVFMESDVGVAGIHRVFPALKRVLREDVDVIVVAAGREGALPTVVAGLVDLPVIGLPVSTGYGHGGKGEAALLAMLQACSLGIAVVNIDSGVAAGAVAALIATRAARTRKRA